jgi:hypothetical protein
VKVDKFKLRQPELDPDPPKIKHVVEEGQTYAIRNGRRFKIETLNADPPEKREDFKLEFVMLPARWVKAPRGANGGVYELAVAILTEKFQRDRIGGEIVLSTQTTGMPSSTRHRAAEELERLGLIKLSREGNHVLKVILI